MGNERIGAQSKLSLGPVSRRRLIAGTAALAFCGSSIAQPYPNRLVSIKSPMAPGSSTDQLARVIAKYLADQMGRPVVVESVLGSGGIIAAQRVLNSPHDGYSLLFSSNSIVSGHAMRKQPPVDVVKDITLVSPVAETPFGMYVSAELPVRNLQEFIAYAKANPGKINYGSSGVGGIVHLIAEDLNMRAGINMVHVPYKGVADLLPSLLVNSIQVTFADTTTLKAHLESGKLKMLAVTSKTRMPQLPAVPTFEESGVKGFVPSIWYGLYAPRATPREVLERINLAMKEILSNPDAQKQFTEWYYQPNWMPLADAQRRVTDELNLLNKTIEASKIERQ